MVRKKPDWDEYRGQGLSAGIATGHAFRMETFNSRIFRIRISESEVESEMKRFREAVAESHRRCLEDKARLEAVVGRELSYIIDAHLLMLEDPNFLGEIEKRIIDKLASPEQAVRDVADELLHAYASLDDDYFRERVADFEDVVDRLIAGLLKLNIERPETQLEQDIILVGQSLKLSQLASVPFDHIKALVLEKVGNTSHVAIIARSYGVPLVSGIEGVRDKIHSGDFLFVDGDSGIVRISRGQGGFELEDEAADSHPSGLSAIIADLEACVTRDNKAITILGNTEIVSEVSSVLDLGAEGVGLFRTEYLYLKRGTLDISEEEHFQVYRSFAETLQGKVGIIRTLDLSFGELRGGEFLAGDEGAVLGLRGIRLSLSRPEMFRTQVRAILRASRYGNLRIVLPMISGLDEFLEVRGIVNSIETSLGFGDGRKHAVQLGVLLEVPSAVMIIESLAREADFFSLGTNDLIQYTLATGRLNEEVSYLYNPLHPAVLFLLKSVSDITGKMGKETVVCGEMASDLMYAKVLVGLGFDCLSVAPLAIPKLKKSLRNTSAEELRAGVNEMLKIEKPREIREYADRVFAESIT